MNLEINGVQYTNFTSASCQLRLDALSNDFSFSAVAPDGQPLPFKGGDECKVIVNNETVLTGYIEIIGVDYDGENHIVTVSGRDKTADLLDSTLDDFDDVRGDGLTLKALIEKVIAKLGLSIQVIDEVNPKAFSITEDIAAPEPGGNSFEFIEQYARKRQVLLTSNADGNIVISSNSGVTAVGAVQHIIGADDNNVISSSFSYDTTGRYNNYRMSSGLNPTALNFAGDTDLASLVNQGGGVFDDEIRKGRQLVLISETPYSDGDCEKRANWEADVRKARGLLYSAVVPDFTADGENLWSINKLYQVVDDFVGKIEPMLCNSVMFTFDIDNGSNTTLGFVGQKAYTLFIEPDPYAEVATNVT